jgi:hypothetical protein
MDGRSKETSADDGPEVRDVTTFHHWFGPEARRLDWDRPDMMLPDVLDLLARAAERHVLGELLGTVHRTPELLEQAERFRLFSKVVLWHDPEARLRLRLHVFGDELVEEAHNHRASFAALILHGAYRHVVYHSEAEFSRDSLRVQLVQDQLPGTGYVLHHQAVHSTVARPGTISIMLQGPPATREFRIVDLRSGDVRVRRGRADSMGMQEPGEARMSIDDLLTLSADLRRIGLVSST